MSSSTRGSRVLTAALAAGALVAGMLALGAAPASAVPEAPVVDLANSVTPTTGDVTVAWNPVQGATSYKYEMSTDPGFSTNLFSLTTAALRATPEEALPSGTIYWRVAAVDGSGQSAWGTGTCDANPDVLYPCFTRTTIAGPTLIGPGSGSPATLTYPTESPVMQWQPVQGATGYTLEYSQDQYFGTATSVTTYTTSYTPNSLLARGVNWYWRVKAAVFASPALTTEWSATGQFTITWPNAAPALLAPSNDPGGATPVSDIRLEWSAVPGAKSYLVEVATDPDFVSPIPGSPFAVKATEYSPARSWDNAAYYWRVNAVDPAGSNGASSSTWQFTRSWGPDSQPNFAPAQRIAAPTPLDSTTSTVTSWIVASNVATITTGAAHGLTVGQHVMVAGLTNAALTNTFTVASTPSATTFTFAVTTANASATEPGTVNALDAPYPVGGETVSLENFRLAWTAVPRASVYEVWLSTDKTFTTDALILKCYTPHTTLTAFDANGILSAGAWTKFNGNCLQNLTKTLLNTPPTFPTTQYYWRVRALDLAATDISTHQFPGVVDASSRFIRSAWSNRDNPSSPASITVTAPNATGAAGDPLSVAPAPTWPAHCANPATCETVPDTPELIWRPMTSAVKGYWVEIALDSSFTNKVAEFHTFTSRLRLDGGLLDNVASQAYYWRVMGCTVYFNLGNKTCLSDESGITRAFRKAGAAVTNLSSNLSGDQVRMTWTEQLLTAPNGGGTRGYEVQIASEPLFNSPTQDLKVDQPFATTSTDLLLDGTWYWRVRVLDGNAAPLPWSSTANFTKAAAKPTLNSVATGPQTPAFSWTSVPGTATYDIEIWSGSNLSVGGSLIRQTTGIQGTSYTLTSALAGGPYSWRIRRHDTDANTLPWTSEPGGAVATFTVSDTVALLAPSTATGNDGLTAASRVVSWSPSSGAARYKVQTSAGPSFSSLLDNNETAQTAYALRSLSYTSAAPDGYYWRVKALNASGVEIGTSETRHFVVLSAPNAPSMTLIAGTFSMTANWTPPSNEGGRPIQSYTLRYRKTGDSTWTTLPAITAPAGTTNVTGLLTNQSYEFQLAATNIVGTGPFASQTKVTLRDIVAPTSGMVLPGTSQTVQYGTTIPVTWSGTDTNGIDSFVVQRAVKAPGGALGSYATWRSVLGSVTSASMTGALPGYTYCFKVQSMDSSGNKSVWSAARCTTLPIDERSMTKSLGWSYGTVSSSNYKSTVLISKKVGASLRTGAARGSIVAVVYKKVPLGGTVAVYYGTKLLGVINTASGSSKTYYKSVTRYPVAMAGYAVKLVVQKAGTGGVSIDGVGFQP